MATTHYHDDASHDGVWAIVYGLVVLTLFGAILYAVSTTPDIAAVPAVGVM